MMPDDPTLDDSDDKMNRYVKKRAEPKEPCDHRTVVRHKSTGQARCYHCGKFLPNALLAKEQSRIDRFFEG